MNKNTSKEKKLIFKLIQKILLVFLLIRETSLTSWIINGITKIANAISSIIKIIF